MKFGIGGKFEMLITKKKQPKMKLENDLRKKITLYQTLFNNSIAMATMEVPWDWLVFKMKAY